MSQKKFGACFLLLGVKNLEWKSEKMTILVNDILWVYQIWKNFVIWTIFYAFTSKIWPFFKIFDFSEKFFWEHLLEKNIFQSLEMNIFEYYLVYYLIWPPKWPLNMCNKVWAHCAPPPEHVVNFGARNM